MRSEKILAVQDSFLQRTINSIMDIVGFIMIIYCCFSFNENPLVMVIIISFFLIMLSLSSKNEIVAYSDAIEFVSQHAWVSSFSKSKKYLLTEIASIDANLQLGKREFIITEIIGSAVLSLSHWNTLVFKLKDGSQKIVSTKIYREKIRTILKTIQETSGNNIVITSN